MRSFTIFLAFLLTIIYVTLAEDNNYEEFLPSGDPSESEWTSGNLVTATNTDLVDAGLFEDPLESYDQQPGQDIASTGGGCSSGGKQTPDILRPRGVDDSCGSNLGPDERPLVVPNIFTMNLEVLCPNKFGELAVNLVCASETAANTQPTIMGTTLLECELVGLDMALFSACYLDSRLYCCKNFDKYVFSDGGFGTGCYDFLKV